MPTLGVPFDLYAIPMYARDAYLRYLHAVVKPTYPHLVKFPPPSNAIDEALEVKGALELWQSDHLYDKVRQINGLCDQRAIATLGQLTNYSQVDPDNNHPVKDEELANYIKKIVELEPMSTLLWKYASLDALAIRLLPDAKAMRQFLTTHPYGRLLAMHLSWACLPPCPSVPIDQAIHDDWLHLRCTQAIRERVAAIVPDSSYLDDDEDCRYMMCRYYRCAKY